MFVAFVAHPQLQQMHVWARRYDERAIDIGQVYEADDSGLDMWQVPGCRQWRLSQRGQEHHYYELTCTPLDIGIDKRPVDRMDRIAH